MNKKKFYIGIALIFLTISVYTCGTWFFFTRLFPGGNDFLPRYLAWKYYLQFGYSPYSEETAYLTNLVVYGRQPMKGEDENREIYPYYYFLLYAPFTVFEYALARAIFMTLLQVCLFGGVYLMMQVLAWKPPPWLLASSFIWVLLDYPQARGIILGQFAILGFFSLSMCLYLLKAHRDFWAGAVLVLATIKPPLVFLIIPLMTLWAIKAKRSKFLLGFYGVLGLLVLVSFIDDPQWFGDWLENLRYYPVYTVGQGPVWMLTHVGFPWMGSLGEWIITGILLGITFLVWYRFFTIDFPAGFIWVLSFTLFIQNIVVPRSATTNYVMLLIPLFWFFSTINRLWQIGKFATLFYQVGGIVGMWWLHISTVQGNQEQPIMFFPNLLIVLLILIFQKSNEKKLNPVLL